MLLISMSMLFLGIKIGSVQISLTDLLQILVKKTVSEDGILEGIIWNVRLPRVVMAYLVGAGLAVSGTVMQSLLGNPLASSYTLGVSAGASLGAALSNCFDFRGIFIAFNWFYLWLSNGLFSFVIYANNG